MTGDQKKELQLMGPRHAVTACGSVASRPNENIRSPWGSENQKARMISVGQ